MRRKSHIAVISAALTAWLVVAVAAPALAQSAPPSLEQAAERVLGKQIRVTTTDGSHTSGKAVSRTATLLEVASTAGSHQVKLADIRLLEMRKPTRKATIWGAAIGAGGGVALGTFSAVTSDGTQGVGTVVGTGAALGTAGGVLGYLLSSGWTTVHAAPAGTPAASVSPQAGPGRLAIRFAIRW